MKRIIHASRETERIAQSNPEKRVSIYSFFPVDRADCICAKLILSWQKKLAQAIPSERQTLFSEQKFLTCPRDKSTLTRFEVLCTKCGQRQGYCFAKDATLSDWCDFHYTQWTDGARWYGCFTPHISPITQTLCFECCCGNDTRDFRANMTLNQKRAEAIELRNIIGREFNRPSSKFLVKQADRNVLL